MEFYEALTEAAECAGLSLSSVGVKLGHSRTYVSVGMSRGSMPSVTNAASMLEVCGYKLCAIPEDSVPADALVIDGALVDPEAARRAAIERGKAALQRRLSELDNM